MKTFRKVLILNVFLAILLGIPLLAGNWMWMFLSWVPAFMAMIYLHDDDL